MSARDGGPDIEIRVESLPRALAGHMPSYLHGAVHPCAWSAGPYRRHNILPITRSHITDPAEGIGEVIRFEVACLRGEHDR